MKAPDHLPAGARTVEFRPGLWMVFPDGATRQRSGWYQGECFVESESGRGAKPLIIDVVPPQMIDWKAAGLHDPERPTVDDLVPLIRELYRGHGAGCCLHVLLDDSNYGCAEHCLTYAREQGHPLCIRIAEMCARMTSTQLRKANRKAHYPEPTP